LGSYRSAAEGHGRPTRDCLGGFVVDRVGIGLLAQSPREFHRVGAVGSLKRARNRFDDEKATDATLVA
jgi:hypothetical protein